MSTAKEICSLLQSASLDLITLSEANVQMLSLLLEDLFQQEPDSFFIKSLQRGNSGTRLITTGHDLIVIKEHLYEENWLLPFNVLNDIVTCMYFYECKEKCAFLPEIVCLSVQKHSTRIFTKFIPLAFEDIFISQLPLVFLRQRFYELVTVVAFLHKHHFAHRDIKPENIRLEHTGKLILIDFDTCCRRECDRYFTRPTCSIHTRAPELEGRTEREISYAANACDIFATGCVLFAMAMNAKLPFPVGPRRLDAIRNFQVSPRLIHRIGEQGANMIKQMLQEDPKVRPSADTILQNNFFHPDIKTKTPEPLLPLMESLSTLPLTLVEPLD